MSNPTVSFRISDYHLARGLRAIRIVDPTWQLTTTSDLIRTIFIDYIAKSEYINNSPLAVTPELLQEIAFSRANSKTLQNEYFKPLAQISPTNRPLAQQKTAQQIQQEIEDEKLLADLKHESVKAQQIKDAHTEEQINKIASVQPDLPPSNLPKPSEFYDPNITESVINTVTDFSPPKDWIEQE